MIPLYTYIIERDDNMNDAFNKKMAEILGRMDEKVLKAKLNAALDMLKKGNTDELAKKIKKVDKEELIEKLNDFDNSKLEDMGINKDEIREKVKDVDFEKVAQLIGEHGDEIVKKIKDIIK